MQPYDRELNPGSDEAARAVRQLRASAGWLSLLLIQRRPLEVINTRTYTRLHVKHIASCVENRNKIRSRQYFSKPRSSSTKSYNVIAIPRIV